MGERGTRKRFTLVLVGCCCQSINAYARFIHQEGRKQGKEFVVSQSGTSRYSCFIMLSLSRERGMLLTRAI